VPPVATCPTFTAACSAPTLSLLTGVPGVVVAGVAAVEASPNAAFFARFFSAEASCAIARFTARSIAFW
jgi:hypothetical protein